MKRFSLLCGVLFSFLSILAIQAQEENLRVLDDWLVEGDAENALYRHLVSEAEALISRRDLERSRILSASEWLLERERVRERLLESLGPFPEKTPLNAVKTGELQREGYRVEKIVFESQPGHHVSSALFLPDRRSGPAPAVLFCSGHSAEAFRSTAYQHMILNLVKKGFVVLAFDPIGQGERLQYLDSSGQASMVGGPTREHSYAGAQAFLAGISIARYFIWDGMRAIDYLLTRPEVDPQRIGITGRSGGGTQSAYIAALDERVAASAPECYITGFRRLLQSIGPQDAEQNFYHGLLEGIDHAELLIARAPRPTRLIATTRDFFSIQGVRETFAELKRVYALLDEGGRISKAEDDAPHASTEKNREAMYRFLIETLRGEADSVDHTPDFLELSALQVTDTGQVLSSFEGVSIFDIISDQVSILTEQLEKRREDLATHLPRVLAESRRLSGYREPLDSVETIFRGRYWRKGYSVEKYIVSGEGEYALPVLLFIPSSDAVHPVTLYLHPEGKEAEAGPGGEIERLVRSGRAVLASDLPGIGELGGGEFKGDAYDFSMGVGDYNRWFFATLIGRSLVGIQAGDIARLLKLIEGDPRLDRQGLAGLAVGNLAPALLHAAAFNPSLESLTLRSSLGSFEDLATRRIYQPRFVHATVPGALQSYDLPDLVAAVAPRRVSLQDPLSADGKALSEESLRATFRVSSRAYAALGEEANLKFERLSEQP